MDLRPFMNPSPYTVNEVSHCVLKFPWSKCRVTVSMEEDIFSVIGTVIAATRTYH